MSKIRVNLTSGNVFEKPLVTCFQGTSANYVVFDNEMNGSMGLPIICISKLNGNRLEKIFDQSEWASVKESLKSIISGSTLMYLEVPENLSAQDDFFTQLTLPVASFDVLKRSYNPPKPEPEVMPAPQPEVAQAPVQSAPEVMETPAPPVMDGPISFGGMNTVNTAPVMNSNPAPQMMGNSDMLGQTNTMAMPNEMASMNNPMPNVNNQMPNPQPNSNINYADLKETFMKSCENMFDALVKRFENK
ncbi:unknown [Mycoplasma sp. CAG:472]|nr:unknown [Mycoplasma sp. CAG:472]